MNKNETKKIYDFFLKAYVGTETQQPFAFPRWLEEFNNDNKEAKTSFVAIQAALAMMAKYDRNTLQEWAQKFAALHGSENFLPLADACTKVSEILRFDHGGFDYPESERKESAGSMHAFACEALQRDTTCATPTDVTGLMLGYGLVDAQVDVYAQDGVGLIYASQQIMGAQLVGDEFAAESERLIPQSLVNINKDCVTWYRNKEFVNRQFLDLEWTINKRAAKSKTLLVNAANNTSPFRPADKNQGLTAGSLNHCLQAGYECVVALVSNHYLTEGRGQAAKLLEFCIHNGLIKIVQLPMGVLGIRSQQHSLLVFNRDAQRESVEFIDLSNAENSREAKRGFGEPRRAKCLQESGDGYWGSSYKEEKSIVSMTDLQKFKDHSFEVRQFSKTAKDLLADLRGRYEFRRLSEMVDIFRAHHIEDLDGERTEYVEIGTNSIDELGWIGKGNERRCSQEALDRRHAQVLLDKDIVMCFRGAPDTFGKVGMYRKQIGEKAVPNQSFVILRQRQDYKGDAYNPEVLMMWLRSPYAQNYLKQCSISPDVVRVKPKQIAEMQVPIGPRHLIDALGRRADEIDQALLNIENARKSILNWEKTAW